MPNPEPAPSCVEPSGRLLWLLLPLLLLLARPAPLVAQVQITEFMASNTRTLRDDFGQYEDWIELYNTSTAPVNLRGWSLSDEPGNPGKWAFPNTNLPPKTFLVVFASNRDRTAPGLALHTNFKLAAEGEYLALFRPDGTAATEFAPYPAQVADVSFGFSPGSAGDLLISPSTVGRATVPFDDAMGTNWLAPAFNDASWLRATNGIGFEAVNSDEPATVFSDVLSDAPVGYWRLSETSGNATLNLGSLSAVGNGQLVGGISLGIPGPRPPDFNGFEPNNRAALLDGIDARFEIPYSPQLNPSAAFTIEAWAKPSRSGGPPAWLVSSMDVDNGRNGYALAQDYSAANQWEFRMGDGSGYIATPHGGSVDTTTWQYLAGVFDGTAARLYVNGVLVASSTLSRPFQPNTAQKTLIGGRVNAPNPYYYTGEIDEVSLTARALSAAEIATRYETATNPDSGTGRFNFTGLINTDLQNQLFGVNSSAYLRLPFVVTNLAHVGQLTLRAKYDDGFLAWLNGTPVATANAPLNPQWNSTASARHPTAEALAFSDFDLTAQTSALRAGTNLLALQALNLAATNTDLLLLVELEARQQGEFQSVPRYFTRPTPAEMNSLGAPDVGPIITDVGHFPAIPQTNDSITVTCRVTQAFGPITNVVLNWRVMFAPLQQTPMFDDGLHGDAAPGDGIFGATIPNQLNSSFTYTAGQMVRWFVTAHDSLSRTSRWPLFENPSDSAEYLGTVVQPDYVSSKLPVFHLFAPPTVLQPGPNTSQIGADSESGGRVALYYDGEFYDNIYMELRGNTSAGLNKKAHRLEFNREHPFRHAGPGPRIRKSSLLAEHLDPAFIRQHLCFWFLDALGVPSPFDYPVRTQLNGAFYQLAFHNDVLGTEQLQRLGYDPEGALYKCAGQVDPYFSSTGGFEKLLPKTNLFDRSDYLELANGINESQPIEARRTAVFDLLDVGQVINYLAGARFCSENDDVWANMCLYRDTYGDGLWRIIPFDMNASWGQLYGGSSPLQATNDYSKSHPFYGGSQVQENGGSGWNRLYDVIVALPETRDMLRRRERSLLDTLVFPPGTPAAALLIENHIKELTNQLSVEAVLDRQKWGSSPWAPGQSFSKGINDLFTQFVPLRRKHWYNTHSITNTAKPLGLGNSFNAGLPLSQPADATISIVGWDVSPLSGNQDEEYLCLSNHNAYAVDVSNWALAGAVTHHLRPGTVIPAGGSLYLSPNVAAFRRRATAPHGGMGVFVQGNYHGHLNSWGEYLTLTDNSGRLVSIANLPATPSLAQQYLRITEILYNPAPLAGSTNDPQSFEYLKLKNISSNQPLSLIGVRLVQGVNFDFSTNTVTNLLPGQMLILARNTNAYAQRFGNSSLVSGQFTGALDNAGETLRLDDARGEKILEFAYNNTWYPATDGLGPALAIVDENAPWSTWDQKSSWHAAGELVLPPPGLHGLSVNSTQMSFSVESLAGLRYSLEHKDDLSQSDWVLGSSQAGTGNPLVFAENLLPATNRFYRLRVSSAE